MAWKYTNVKVPTETACMITCNGVREMLRIFGVDATEWAEASVGWSANGPWSEGDVFGMDGNELLSYDFMEVGDTARIFRYWAA